ncbi:hypothetical protein HYDPIDRAFT_106450 [Hydnomerulius pinastri MD-312]|nr:hypothetical protein HYDPIDRAFT_106450 [Hydnomerulius pinastri MD-312]
MDPELASEMVKLLGQELKVVRGQLREAERRNFSSPAAADSTGLTREQARALISENESLKTENSALHANISRLQDELTEVHPIKAEEGATDAKQYEESMHQMREELAQALAERDFLAQEKGVAADLREQLSTLREKYKRSKAEKNECLEVMDELRTELLKCTEELEKAHKSRKSSALEMDFMTYFENTPYEPVADQPTADALQPFSRKLHGPVPKPLTLLCAGPYLMNSHEVVWSPSGFAQGLVIKPSYQYNPKAQDGTWIKLSTRFEADQQMDVCFLESMAWHYIGTYERVGEIITLPPESLEQLGPGKLEYAAKRTTLFQDLVPPSQTRMVEKMYTKGVLRLECFGIRCIGFNTTFSGELLKLASQKPRGIATPISPGVTKEPARTAMKRKAKSTDLSTKSKKLRI